MHSDLGNRSFRTVLQWMVAWVTAIAMAAALAGCSGEGTQSGQDPHEAQSVPSDRAEMTTAMQPVWTTKLPVVSQPVVTGNVAIVLASSPQQHTKQRQTAASGAIFQVVALDLTTGAELWSKPFDAMEFDEDTVLKPLVVKDDSGRELVVFRGPNRSLPAAWDRSIMTSYSPLQAVLPRTGRTVGERGVSGPYGSCPDGRGVCLDGGTSYSGDFNDADGLGPVTGGEPPARWDPARPRREPKSLGGPDATLNIDEAGLYTTRMGEPRVLRLDEGKQQWAVPMTKVVGPQYSTDQGWTWRHDPHSDTFVGSLGYRFSDQVYARYGAGKPVTWDLAGPRKLVGLSGETGQRLWRIDADPWCELVTWRADDQWAACAYGGTMTQQDGKPDRLDDVSLRVIGYDPATGAETWSVEADQAAAKNSLRDDKTIMAPDGVVVGTTEGPAAIDLGTGDVTQVKPGTVTWCTDDLRKMASPERTVGPLFFACTADGKRAEAPVSEWGVAALDDHEGWRLASVQGRVMAYQFPGAQ